MVHPHAIDRVEVAVKEKSDEDIDSEDTVKMPVEDTML